MSEGPKLATALGTMHPLDPDTIERIRIEVVPRLLAWIASEQTRLSSLQTALTARLLEERPAPEDGAGARVDDGTLGLQEAARLLQKSPSWLRRAARRGEFPFARKIGRSLVFPRAQLLRYLDHALPCYERDPNPIAPGAGGGRASARTTSGWRPPTRKERPA